MKLTQEELKELIYYDPHTGVVSWKPRPLSMFKREPDHRTWNTRYAGKRAGCVRTNKHGYQCRIIVIGGKNYKEHRIIWLYMVGEPPKQIDHIDRDGTNNAWANLRDGTNGVNGMNLSLSKNNTSGITGVNWDKRREKWFTRVTCKGKTHFLGYYENKEDAERVVIEKRKELGFTDTHGK